MKNLEILKLESLKLKYLHYRYLYYEAYANENKISLNHIINKILWKQ